MFDSADGYTCSADLSSSESQLARGEPPEDTARVLSEMTDAIMVRTFEHEILNMKP